MLTNLDTEGGRKPTSTRRCLVRSPLSSISQVASRSMRPLTLNTTRAAAITNVSDSVERTTFWTTACGGCVQTVAIHIVCHINGHSAAAVFTAAAGRFGLCVAQCKCTHPRDGNKLRQEILGERGERCNDEQRLHGPVHLCGRALKWCPMICHQAPFQRTPFLCWLSESVYTATAIPLVLAAAGGVGLTSSPTSCRMTAG